MNTLTVILPCFNEANAVQKVIADWKQESSELLKHHGLSNIEILVVDDGSSDGGCDHLEAAELQSMVSGVSLKVLRHSKNQGYGQSLKTGLTKAQGEWIVFHDCDGTCRAEDFKKLWAKKDEADLVIGRRMGENTGMPWLRRLGNGLYQNLFKIFFQQPSHDLCSGYRLFHRKWVDDFTRRLPDQLNFTLAMSLWMTLSGRKVLEVPITYLQRIGDSKLSAWVDGWRFLFTIIRYRLIGFHKDN